MDDIECFFTYTDNGIELMIHRSDHITVLIQNVSYIKIRSGINQNIVKSAFLSNVFRIGGPQKKIQDEMPPQSKGRKNRVMRARWNTLRSVTAQSVNHFNKHSFKHTHLFEKVPYKQLLSVSDPLYADPKYRAIRHHLSGHGCRRGSRRR